MNNFTERWMKTIAVEYDAFSKAIARLKDEHSLNAAERCAVNAIMVGHHASMATYLRNTWKGTPAEFERTLNLLAKEVETSVVVLASPCPVHVIELPARKPGSES